MHNNQRMEVIPVTCNAVTLPLPLLCYNNDLVMMNFCITIWGNIEVGKSLDHYL